MASDLHGLRVLLAEDNPINQMVASQMLEALGANVTVAGDGAEALEIVQQGDFDLMLIDIEMPRVSGIDVMRALRASNGKLAEMPLIALTAYVMREHRTAIDAAGADGLIAKPIVSIEQFGGDILACIKKRGALPRAGVLLTEEVTGEPEFNTQLYATLQSSLGPEDMQELLKKVQADVEASRETIIHGLRLMDFRVIRTATHVLISVAGAVGAVRLQTLARQINGAANTQDDAEIRATGPEMLAEIERVLRFVASELG
ncbi:MAG: response regulator [Pseudomonadota bacterium]